ncbi:unnamed protein product [Chrysodeixis includens]|uniref:FLYWCH-type domain-containing protein n=1 Tax=Chrysodeixis includens TaxID=689277 RepID=A0A9N8Q152_CHRIL|nr:unnamed protein product [Chrysodeixis includens]
MYVPSRTGKSLLLHDGYTFYLKNLQAHGRKQWYCSSRDMAGCRADVITAPARAGAGDVLFLVRGRHIHAPPSYYFTPDGKYVRKKDVYHRPAALDPLRCARGASAPPPPPHAATRQTCARRHSHPGDGAPIDNAPESYSECPFPLLSQP